MTQNSRSICLTLSRARQAAKAFLKSTDGRKAKLLLIGLLLAMLGINTLNVVNSYVSRDLMSSIEGRSMTGLASFALLWILVFAVCTVVAVFFRYAEERLALLWREWLTREAVDAYFDSHSYYYLHSSGALTNPDQRISEDIRAFTTTSLSFVLMFLNATLTVLAFTSVLWTISGHLLCVAVAYAIIGSAVTVWFGKPLLRLNYSQFDKEANFRADLLQVGEHADAIVMQDFERQVQGRLQQRISDLIANSRRIIAVNRNLSFFTTGYNYLIQLLPIVFVGRMFIQGQVEFGVIAQSGIAFAAVTGAFSLIVTQFQSLSTYASVVTRVKELTETLRQSEESTKMGIKFVPADDGIAFDGLIIKSVDDDSELIKDLTFAIPRNARVLIKGGKTGAKEGLARAVAGLDVPGNGVLMKPHRAVIAFLPDNPYIPAGSLRSLFTEGNAPASEADIHQSLEQMGIRDLILKAGGLDFEQSWSDVLSREEKQLLVLASILVRKPGFVFLPALEPMVSSVSRERIFDVLNKAGSGWVMLGDGEHHLSGYNRLVELSDDGSWKATIFEKS